MLHNTIQEIRTNATAKWKPDQVLVVAEANEFEADALDLAHAFGIECYERTNSSFVLR
jgi:hypothetical protein